VPENLNQSNSADLPKDPAEAGAPELGAQPEPEPVASLTPEAALELVAEGQRLLGQGRTEEALSRATQVLEDTPDHLAALALKGDSLEKSGDLAGALDCYERILELKPDSAMDRIRATHLRRHAALQDLDVEEAPSKTKAVLAAAAATVLFLVVTTVAFMMSQGRPAGEQVTKLDPQPAYTNFPGVPPVPTGPETVTQGQQEAQASSSALQPRLDSGYVAPPRQSPGSRAVNITPSSGAEVEPVNPLPNGAPPITIRPNGGIPSGPTVPMNPTNPGSGGTGAGGASPDEPDVIASVRRPNPGVVDIRPSSSSPVERPSSNPGTTPITDEEDARQSATTLVRVAREAFVQGDYSRAADAYEKALRMGASKGSTNQRLAQCYERLGRRQDAISAYERAIASYQSQLSSGEDNARITAALESSRQALRVLRGG
jgi:tetratricopeptide (TPR) repeat protein